MKRFPVFKSRISVTSRRIGAVALPVALIAVLAHRLGGLAPDQMILAILVATAMGLSALLLALAGFAQFWKHGGRGIGNATLGALYGLVALLPAAALAAGQLVQGGGTDVSTNEQDPPELNRPETDPGLLSLTDLSELRVQEGNADIVSRRYRIQPAALHLAALKAADRNGWQVVDETPPDLLDAPTRFQAEVRTPVLGLIEDVAVRIRPDPVGALFDIRSASRYPLQDIGGNAARIRSYYSDVDEVLLETYGDIESLTVLEEEVADDIVTVEAPVGEEAAPRIPVPAFKPFVEGSEEPVAEGLLDTIDDDTEAAD